MLRFMMLGEPLPEAVAEGEIGEAEHERAISPAAWAQDAAALMGIATAPLAAFLNAAPSEDSTFLRLQWSPFLGLTGWMRRAADRLRRLAPPRAGALIPRAVAPPAYRLVDLPREYMPLFIAHAQRLVRQAATHTPSDLHRVPRSLPSSPPGFASARGATPSRTTPSCAWAAAPSCAAAP